jgi:hypothetical protein
MCVFEFNGGVVDHGAVLSNGKLISAANDGHCVPLSSLQGTSLSALSYYYMVNGGVTDWTFSTYTSTDCSGVASIMNAASNANKCKNLTLLTTVKSVKSVYPN